MSLHPSHRSRLCFVCVLASMVLIGCNGIKEFPVAPTQGTVTCDGKPIPYAMIFFEPLVTGESAIVGKQGLATADKDGAFVVSSYHENDGAVIGKHKVHVLPPHNQDHPGFRCPCEFDSKAEPILVEIKRGKNEFAFVLPIRETKQLTQDEKEALQEAEAEEASRQEAIENASGTH